MSRVRLLRWTQPLVALLFCLWMNVGKASRGIPGTTQTISGYDTEMGVDSICWKSQGATEGIAMPNPLLEDYIVSMSGVTLLTSCPAGNNISAVQPNESVVWGQRLRTGVEYNYTVFLDINMTSLQATAGFTSDRGPGRIAVQVLNCVAGVSGFCSPYIHEEANFRLAETAAAVRAANPNVPEVEAPPRPRGALHGESHVHSGYVDVYLPPEDGPIYKNFEVVVPVVVLEPGDYFSIASAQMYVQEEAQEGQEPELFRWDMANALIGTQRLVQYQAPAEILEVPSGVVYFAYGLIALSSAAILFLLYGAVKHRNNQIMRLSQGSFVVMFLLMALVATATSFLSEPKNDLYCRISFPITMISLQILYAITAGRLWRIHALISPLLLKTLSMEMGKTWDGRLMMFFQRVGELCTVCVRSKTSSPQKLRNKVSDAQLALGVCVLVLPQVVIQILALVLQPRSRSVDFNDDESRGRAVCETDEDVSVFEDIVYYGYLALFLLVIGLFMMALQSRKLPSLFNEAKTILDSTVTSLTIMIMGSAVTLVTQEPSNSPAVTYLVQVFVILSITVNMSLRIVLPKLRMIWRGETVVVSRLMMDHTRQIRGSKGISTISGSESHGVGIYEPGSISSPHGQSPPPGGQMPRSFFSDLVESEREEEGEDPTTGSSEPTPKRQAATTTDTTSTVEGPVGKPSSTTDLNKETSALLHQRKGIVIESDQSPSRRVTLRLLDMQEHLHNVTQKIMSGTAVSHEEWERTRYLTRKMGKLFDTEVSFGWEPDEVVEPKIGDDSSRFLVQEPATSADLYCVEVPSERSGEPAVQQGGEQPANYAML